MDKYEQCEYKGCFEKERHYAVKIFRHEIGDSLKRLTALGYEEASRQNVPAGKYRYMWADAICNELYEKAKG
jgi:hypothetical protein